LPSDSLGRIPQAGLEALYEDLERTGDWYGIAPNGSDGIGRVLVQRVVCGDYIQDAEIMRTADGRGWLIYADSQCPTCQREVRVSRRLPGTEVDLVSAINATVLELGTPAYAEYQHLPTCAQRSVEAEAE